MARSAIYEKTVKRLTAYNLFDTQCIEEVARLAQEQSQFETYQQFFKSVDVPLEPTLFIAANGRGVPLVDIDARESKEKGVLVVHLPMGNSLDANQLYQIATLALAFPAHRIIAFGNPSGKPLAYKQENLSFVEWLRVAFTKKLRGLVSAELEYLTSQNIQNASHVGYSYGAHKALLCAYYADSTQVSKVMLVDPVAHPRYRRQLLKDFSSTFEPLGKYVNRTELQSYFDARADAAEQVKHSQGIRRPVNIAIGLMLARIDFISWVTATLSKHPKLRAAVAWGSKSELGNDAHMKASLHNLAYETAKGRVKMLRLQGDAHAFPNDVHLYAAIVLQSLK